MSLGEAMREVIGEELQKVLKDMAGKGWVMRHQVPSELEGAEWLSPEAVEKVFSIPETTLVQWRRNKVGPAFSKVGKRVYYKREAVERYLAKNLIATTDDPRHLRAVPRR